MANQASGIFSGTDILGNGIQENSGPVPHCDDKGNCVDNALGIPILTDTNFDRIIVGDDYARAFGWSGFFPFINDPSKAVNNLEIKKNQQVGACENCCNTSREGAGDNCSVCTDACKTVNVDQVYVGGRNAQALGNAEAVNNVKLVLNQAT
jgi:hypothetical protein